MRRAFRELQSDRAVTMAGLGPIPFTAIDRYAARYGVRDFDRFCRLIRAMEAAQYAHREGITRDDKEADSDD